MHQKVLDWSLALLALAIGLLALIGVLLFAWHVEDATPWASMGAGDWGVWVGSIGAVGAFFGTLWVATSQSRKEMTQARLHAAGFMLRIADARGAVGRVCRNLSIDAQIDRGEAKITMCIFDLDEIKLWTASDLVPMAPLSPRVIGQLAEASDQISTAIKALEMVRGGDDSLSTPAKRMNFARKLHRLLSGTAGLLDEGIKVCDHARRSLHMHPG